MTIQDISRYRLYFQHITHLHSGDPATLVAQLGAIQAQDFPGAKWSIGLRLPGVTDADVERAIADRKIVRTWPMRGTLHFVAAADVRWMLELLTPRVVAGSVSRQQLLKLDRAAFDRCAEILGEVLAGGKESTRDEIYHSLGDSGISTAGSRGYHILWRLAQEGLICFGPHSDKQPTFVLLEEWVPGAKRLPRSEALAELARRYFTGHGPATLADFCWWSGLTATDAKAGIEAARAHLVQETVDGKTYWLSPEAPELSGIAPSVSLLPGFDEYLLGYRERGAALDPIHAEKIVPGKNGVFMPTIVVDGSVVGIWKRVIKKRTVVITLEPFRPLNDAESQAGTVAAERYGGFLGMPVQVA